MLEWKLEDVLEARWEEGMEKGIEKGMEHKAIETARNLLEMGFFVEDVAKGTGLDLESVQGLV